MALSSSGQDGALSRLKLGFESRQGHFNDPFNRGEPRSRGWRLARTGPGGPRSLRAPLRGPLSRPAFQKHLCRVPPLIFVWPERLASERTAGGPADGRLVRRASLDELRHCPGPELNRGRFEKWSAQRAWTGVLARLSSAVGSFAVLAYVCTATGSIATSVAIYILSAAAAALTLRGLGWRFVPRIERAVANARGWFGRCLRHGAPSAAEAREGHGG
jgi:hypothetical protein